MEAWKKECVERLAGRIRRLRLETPALIMLEAHRPLARLAGHLLAVAEPVAAGLLGLERVERVREVLFDGEAVDLLCRMLEPADDADAAD